MVRLVSLVLLAFVWLGTPSASSAEPRAYAQGLLWRIEAPNAPASYVFGTVHVSDARVQALLQDMLAAVGPLDSISLEIVPTPETMAEAAQYMFAPNGPSLSQRVGPALFQQIVAAAAPYGLSAGALERFKPWAIAVTISLPVSELRAQAAGQLNSEKLLASYATTNRIPLYGIETVGEQLNLFDRLPEPKQIEMLRLAVQFSGSIEQLFNQLLDAYLAQDLDAIYRLMEKMAVGDQANLQDFFERDLIANRNRRMVERIQVRLAQGNALIAVGALHLPDKVGVLHLLEKRGYKITRVALASH